MTEHRINLEGMPGARAGLEAIRQRRWAALAEDERRRVKRLYTSAPPELVRMVPFNSLKDTHQRVLYALAMPRGPLSAGEIVYLLLARWMNNVDLYTVRARLAKMALKGEVEEHADGRFSIAQAGWDRLYAIKKAWLRRNTIDDTARAALINYRKGGAAE